MTRKEVTGKRSLAFNNWMREALPDSSTGLSVSDIDFVVFNWKTKKVMLIEAKTKNSHPRYNQKVIFGNLNRWIMNGIDEGWQYLGFHLVTFEKTSFADGKCYLDGNEITENELIEFLSL